MRLIDADRFCNTLLDFIHKQYGRKGYELEYEVSMEIHDSLRNAPTIDAEPVVRCKDCKRWLHDVPGCTDVVGRCEWAGYMIGANGYCLYGEVIE